MIMTDQLPITISKNEDNQYHDLGPLLIIDWLVDSDPMVEHLLDDDFPSFNSYYWT